MHSQGQRQHRARIGAWWLGAVSSAALAVTASGYVLLIGASFVLLAPLMFRLGALIRSFWTGGTVFAVCLSVPLLLRDPSGNASKLWLVGILMLGLAIVLVMRALLPARRAAISSSATLLLPVGLSALGAAYLTPPPARDIPEFIPPPIRSQETVPAPMVTRQRSTPAEQPAEAEVIPVIRALETPTARPASVTLPKATLPKPAPGRDTRNASSNEKKAQATRTPAPASARTPQPTRTPTPITAPATRAASKPGAARTNTTPVPSPPVTVRKTPSAVRIVTRAPETVAHPAPRRAPQATRTASSTRTTPTPAANAARNAPAPQSHTPAPPRAMAEQPITTRVSRSPVRPVTPRTASITDSERAQRRAAAQRVRDILAARRARSATPVCQASCSSSTPGSAVLATNQLQYASYTTTTREDEETPQRAPSTPPTQDPAPPSPTVPPSVPAPVTPTPAPQPDPVVPVLPITPPTVSLPINPPLPGDNGKHGGKGKSKNKNNGGKKTGTHDD